MRDGILGRMRPDKNYGDTAARLCQPHMEAGNSLATASRLIVGNTLLVTGVDLRRERGMPASMLLLLLLLIVARRGLLLFRFLYSSASILVVAAATHKRQKHENSFWLTLSSAVTHE